MALNKIFLRHSGDISDANDGVMGIKCADFAEMEREVAGNNNDFFTV